MVDRVTPLGSGTLALLASALSISGWNHIACGGSSARDTDTTPVADAEVVDETDAHSVDSVDSAEGVDGADTVADAGLDVAPLVCDITAPTVCPEPAPTFEVIAPIIDTTCVPCHFGAPDGPWPLDSYEHVTDWRDTIRSAMLDCSMPPPEENIAMRDEERVLILEWIRCGMPRGAAP
jgi:hypothetical protein